VYSTVGVTFWAFVLAGEVERLPDGHDDVTPNWICHVQDLPALLFLPGLRLSSFKVKCCGKKSIELHYSTYAVYKRGMQLVSRKQLHSLLPAARCPFHPCIK
jgi:hypothetical protein